MIMRAYACLCVRSRVRSCVCVCALLNKKCIPDITISKLLVVQSLVLECKKTHTHTHKPLIVAKYLKRRSTRRSTLPLRTRGLTYLSNGACEWPRSVPASSCLRTASPTRLYLPPLPAILVEYFSKPPTRHFPF